MGARELSSPSLFCHFSASSGLSWGSGGGGKKGGAWAQGISHHPLRSSKTPNSPPPFNAGSMACGRTSITDVRVNGRPWSVGYEDQVGRILGLGFWG